jgi:antitoxin VapB
MMASGSRIDILHQTEEWTQKTLQIRDRRARQLAQKLAAARKLTMTEAVIQALEQELRRELEKEPLAVRLKRIAGELAAKGRPGGRAMTKEEIDEMWGH